MFEFTLYGMHESTVIYTSYSVNPAVYFWANRIFPHSDYNFGGIDTGTSVTPCSPNNTASFTIGNCSQNSPDLTSTTSSGAGTASPCHASDTASFVVGNNKAQSVDFTNSFGSSPEAASNSAAQHVSIPSDDSGNTSITKVNENSGFDASRMPDGTSVDASIQIPGSSADHTAGDTSWSVQGDSNLKPANPTSAEGALGHSSVSASGASFHPAPTAKPESYVYVPEDSASESKELTWQDGANDALNNHLAGSGAWTDSYKDGWAYTRADGALQSDAAPALPARPAPCE